MATAHANLILRHIRGLVAAEETSKLSDRQLIERFVVHREEAAFAALVRRHGPLVLGVCRRVLHDWSAAEDVFQAAFLVLARKAGSIAKQESVGSWLYQVAFRLAVRARTKEARRKAREREAGRPAPADPLAEVSGRELLSVLDEELQRLAERYRAPLVLCYLEGRTCDQAARQLGWSLRTLKRRLEEGKQRLRCRLARRGLALSAGLLAAGLTQGPATAAVSPTLLNIAVQAALLAAAGKSGVVSASATALAEEVSKTMLLAKLKTTAALMLAVGVAALAASALGHKLWVRGQGVVAAEKNGSVSSKSESQDRSRAKVEKPSAEAPPHGQRKSEDQLTVTGRVLDPQGKPIAKAQVALVAWLKFTPKNGEPMVYVDSKTEESEVLGRTHTDDEGRFQLQVAKEAGKRSYMVKALAAASGYGLGWQAVDLDAKPPGAAIRLQAEQVVHARLIDLQGQPVPAVRVEVVRFGTVSIPSKRQYTINARQMDTSTIFYADFDDKNEMMKATPGSSQGIQFQILPAGLSFWPRPVTTDAKGRFTLHGVSRNQEIGLQVRDERFAFETPAIPPRDKDEAEEVAVALGPARVLEGTVTDAANGKPLPEARLTVHTFPRYFGGLGAVGNTDGKGRRFDFQFHVSMGVPIFRSDGRTDEKGRFRIKTYSGRSYVVTVSGPEGQSYLRVTKTIAPAKALVKQELNIALPPGVPVHGRVSDAATGKPVAEATVDFWSKGLSQPEEVLYPKQVRAGQDGRFQAILPPGSWHLLVNGGYGSRYLGRRIPVLDVEMPPENKAPEKPFYLPDEWVKLDLKAGEAVRKIAVELRKAFVKGRVFRADSTPAATVRMLERHTMMEWQPRATEVPDGNFELPITDLHDTFPLVFFDPVNGQGAAAEVAGKQAGGEAVTVRLQPCGSAKARFVDSQGKPLANYRPVLWVLFPPAPPFPPDHKSVIDMNMRAEGAIWMAHADPKNYGDSATTDTEGRIVFQNLIPGATYRLVQFDGTPDSAVKEFKVESRKVLDLADITVKHPEKAMKLPAVKPTE